MSLHIGDALSNGLAKLQTTVGLQLSGLYVVTLLLTALGANSMVTGMAPELPSTATPALSLPIGAAAGAALMLVGLLGTVVLSVVVLRAVDHPVAELDSYPAGLTRTLPKTIVFLLIAGLIQGILVAVGLVLLVIPGLFVLVSLYFSQVYIAVEDQGPIEGLSSSWSLAKGNRFRVFGLLVVLGVVGILGSIFGELVGLASPTAGSVLSLVLSGFVSVFSSAVIVDAYQQLSREQTEREDLLQEPT